MAEPWHVAIAPHTYNSTTVGLAQHAPVSACIPKFLITEYSSTSKPSGKRSPMAGSQ
jgi:L-alanine-DL-glutamate epimerase-like enolase superfamily enzyme